MYYVYILASRRHGTLYIGVTNSLRKRLDELRAYLIPGQTRVTCRSEGVGSMMGTYKGISSSNRMEVIDDATHVVFSFRPTELHL